MDDETAATIIENYINYDENGRLKTPYGILEELHTRELIMRYLRPLNALRVLDVGGATGPYSFWLSSLGFEVHLSDIVPSHIEAAQANGNSSKLASIQVEDARSLSYPDNFADCIILNGPLYHLISRGDRELVLRECLRVLRKHGLLFAFAIGRYSGLLYSLNSGSVFSNEYFNMVRREIVTGIRSNPDGKNKTFLEAYFHSSSELQKEITDCGFTIEGIIGVLGQSWNISNLEGSLKETEKRERLMEVARLMEELPDLSPKILGIGRK